MTDCRCKVTLAGQPRCMHSQHAKYRLPIADSDCAGCPLKSKTVDGEPVLPSLLQRTKNLAGDIGNITRSGFATVTKAALDARLAVCETCPMKKSGSCAVCGCTLALKAKYAVEQWPPQILGSHQRGRRKWHTDTHT